MCHELNGSPFPCPGTTGVLNQNGSSSATLSRTGYADGAATAACMTMPE